MPERLFGRRRFFSRCCAIGVFALVAAAGGLAGCGDKARQAREAAPPAVQGPPPDSFRVAFETTRGRFVVDVLRRWAPHGADRFHDLVDQHFFDDVGFFRVVPGFIAQFGVSGDPKVNDAWDAKYLPDDSLVVRNTRGTVVFAMDGPRSRTHQLFINLRDSPHLDQQHFAPIGRVVEGMGTVDSIYSAYREKPEAHMIATLGNSYLARMFPKLDYIKTARFVSLTNQ